ncbi:MAG: NapC/NirT family cytochrome c, partial [Acidobacteria bacterium]|nr:NapC/NirT family cytochrome c [Acidobacteriota bacterium]
MKLKSFPQLTYNWITALGAVLALVSGVTLGVLLVVVFSLEDNVNPYFGIFLYTLGPPVLVLGLLLIPIGMVREWRRLKREGIRPEKARWPAIDLNRPAHRNFFLVFVVGGLIFVVISAVGTYGTYHFSESVTFCGTTCHEVMEPEYVSYQYSPHSRISCSECHVGSGANWYVKSKLSGAYQVWATLRNIYPRPIPTPIESLRPAQQTCEQCHWPERMIGSQQRSFYHVMYDEESTEWPIDMLLKTGGGDPKSGHAAGIHAHMNIAVEVHYIARDERRQDIPWIEVADPTTGRVTVYEDSENPLTEEEKASAVKRRMDCMDCHNR